jgi:hypothetical protein
MIELTALTETGLNANTAVELRKAAAELGIKGASKGRKADLIVEIMKLVDAAKAEAAKQAEVKPTKRGVCTECGRKEDFRASGLCAACRTYGEWENEHNDHRHGEIAAALEAGLGEENLSEGGKEELAACPICHPELDPRKPVAKREGRSRAGMEIVAKGTEVHKSNTFKVAAEAAGWTVKITATEEGRYYADAHKGDEAIQLAWVGRAYGYPSSSARINGKDRKVRNLKEALRLLAA